MKVVNFEAFVKVVKEVFLSKAKSTPNDELVHDMLGRLKSPKIYSSASE